MVLYYSVKSKIPRNLSASADNIIAYLFRNVKKKAPHRFTLVRGGGLQQGLGGIAFFE